MSREHIWSDWIRRDLLTPDERKRRYWHSTRTEDGEQHRHRQALFTARVKGVCQPCNGHWMSDLETAVKPYASPMIVGRGKQLHAEGQQVLAAWATTKVMAVQNIQPERGLIPPEHLAEMYACRREQHPPSGTQVFAAATAERGNPPGLYHHHLLERRRDPGEAGSPVEPQAYLVTLSVLHLVVQVFRPLVGLDAYPSVNHPRPVRGSVRRIWPEPESFEWPPGPRLTKNGLRLLAGGV